jgi:two-component system OmpR family sensor kinase
MRKHGVLLTVLFAFSVSILTISTIFWEFYQLNKKQYIDNIFTKYSVITQIYREHKQRESSEIMLEANFAIYNFKMIKEGQKLHNILNNGKALKKKGFNDKTLLISKKKLFSKKDVKNLRIAMIQYSHDIYFFLQSPKGFLLVQDEELKPYKPWNILYAYTIIIIIVIFSFTLILQRLRPLIVLRKKIAQYGEGNMNICFETGKKDEIAVISTELEKTKNKINNLLESRTLFLRNVMHELKTPIAKGTIATQMLDSQKQIDRFSSIFGRLESLVSEFALIEEVTSLSNQEDYNDYRLVDILDDAVDMAMIDKSNITIDIPTNKKVYVNFRLYTTAVKNMIDNGIKYSTDSHVRVIYKNDELCFESKGECIKHPLSYYIEPFTKDNPSKNSFGLGLYLVDSILKAHNQVLAHEYENGVNRFIFA